MKRFITAHRDSVIGTLSGWDRIRFRGTLRLIANDRGLLALMNYLHVLLVHFKDWASALSEQLKTASLALAEAAGRPSIYLPRASACKEEIARRIAQEDHITDGLICVLRTVEPCPSFHVKRDPTSRKLVLESSWRKCTHLYHYLIHPTFGFMHARLQSWLPFNLHVCVNGREWLGRQMDAAGIAYARRDNCFAWVSDLQRAQSLLDGQSQKTDWPTLLGSVVPAVHPAHAAMFATRPMDYYFSAEETEFATDVLFRDADSLGRLFPQLIRHGMQNLSSRDVLRFLGQKVPAGGGVYGQFRGEVVSDLKHRAEGVRLKHRANANSIKMYDKQRSVLRVETTINNTRVFKVYRTAEGQPADAEPTWQRMRKGVADLARRGRVSLAANERYLDALADVRDTTPLRTLLEPLCRPTRFNGRRVRALNVLSPDDAGLLRAVARGEFTLNGFRNRDLRGLLCPATDDPRQLKRQAARITRLLRLLRGHGLIHKIAKTHRYQLTPTGRTAITALLSAADADTAKLAA